MPTGDRVRQARECCGLTQKQLSEATQRTQSAIAQIEIGYQGGSPEIIQAISEATRFPTSFFERPAAPDFPHTSLLFRAHRAITSSQKREARQHARISYEMYSDLKLTAQCGNSPFRLKLSASSPSLAAQEARRSFGIPEGPIGHLINHFEHAGILVLALPALRGRDAFSFWIENLPVIAVLSCGLGDHLRVTAAHELGHLLIHKNKPSSQVNDREADEFALEFLMPKSEFLRDLTDPIDLDKLAAAKEKWRVPMITILRRLRDLRRLTKLSYEYHSEIIKSRWGDSEPVLLAIEKPRLLRKLAEACYGNPLDFARLAKRLDLYPAQVESILRLYEPVAEPPARKREVVSISRRKKGR
jgi:Zn-dependent peptidase ImmA (M78 family)/transcriptional regulator with XRE-family HTH domain